MAGVILEGITKRFGSVVAVDNLTLKIGHGEFLFLLGPSGCGKTTLLRTIAGYERPDSGRLFFDDRESTHIHPSKRNIGMVFQNYALFQNRSVYKNVEFGLRVRRVHKPERRRRIMNSLEMVKLEDLAQRYPLQLSGGQQQRVALARAIVIDPDILLLDEPLGALDRKLRGDMQLELKMLQKKLKITTIFVTHDQEEALTMADRIVLMKDGRCEQLGSPLEIYERPATEFVASFIGAINFLAGTVVSVDPDVTEVRTPDGLRIIMDTVAGTVIGDRGTFVVRPEKLVLGRTMKPQYDNVMLGRIQNSLYMGDMTHYYIAVADRKLLVVEQNLSVNPALYEVGCEVFVHFDRRSVLAISMHNDSIASVERGAVQA